MKEMDLVKLLKQVNLVIIVKLMSQLAEAVIVTEVKIVNVLIWSA